MAIGAPISDAEVDPAAMAPRLSRHRPHPAVSRRRPRCPNRRRIRDDPLDQHRRRLAHQQLLAVRERDHRVRGLLDREDQIDVDDQRAAAEPGHVDHATSSPRDRRSAAAIRSAERDARRRRPPACPSTRRM